MCTCVQVVIALSGGELVYFEMDMVSEQGKGAATVLTQAVYAIHYSLA